MTIWRIRTVCWIPEGTNTYSAIVFRIAFPLQQWLHDRASTLRYKHIASIVVSDLFNDVLDSSNNRLTDEEGLSIHGISLRLLPFKAQRFLYVPPGLTFKNSTWHSLCVVPFVPISEQTATFVLYIINRLVFITVVGRVYRAVRTVSLYKADYVSPLNFY